MFELDASTRALTEAIVRYAVDRIDLDPPPLDGPQTPQALAELAGRTITAEGIGGLEALRVFADILAPACISV
ncbi:MAG: aspartate aminotransferase family protein, partial [Ilumatobacteraceae bacterium]